MLRESKLPFVSRIEFIRSKLSNFSAHVSGVTEHGRPARTHRRCLHRAVVKRWRWAERRAVGWAAVRRAEGGGREPTAISGEWVTIV